MARQSADGLLHALEAKSRWTWEHSIRVGKLAAELGRLLGAAPQDVDSLRIAGELHDIGKLGVPAQILDKPGALEPWEASVIDHHNELGAALVKNTGVLEREWLMVRCHHVHHNVAEVRRAAERSGIATACSIISVADAFDAMTSDRPYRRAVSPEVAISELRRSSGEQFTPEVVEALSQRVEGSRRRRRPACETAE